MHEMQNRMKITCCVKLPLPSILLAVKEAPREVFGGLSWPSAGADVMHPKCKKTGYFRANLSKKGH